MFSKDTLYFLWKIDYINYEPHCVVTCKEFKRSSSRKCMHWDQGLRLVMGERVTGG